MKINRFLLCCLIAVTTASCRNEGVPPNKKYLLNRWQVKSVVTTRYKNQVKTSVTNSTAFGAANYLEFNENGTGYFGLKGPDGTIPFGAISYNVTGRDQDIINVNSPKASFIIRIISADQATLRITYPDDTSIIPLADGDYYDVQLVRH